MAAAGKLPSVFANSPIRSLDPVASPNISATDRSIATADGVPCVGPCVSRRCTLGNHRGDVERPRHRLLPSPRAASSVELRRSTPPNTPGRAREDAGRAVDGRAVSTRVRQQRPIGLDVPRSWPRIARTFETASAGPSRVFRASVRRAPVVPQRRAGHAARVEPCAHLTNVRARISQGGGDRSLRPVPRR